MCSPGVIRGLGTFVVLLAQLADGGGLGAWPIGVSSLIAVYIALLSYLRRSDVAITKPDWAFFLAALLPLPCWFLTSDPLWAVIILAAVDIAGFGPTFRSAYVRPHDGRRGFFALSAVRSLIAILALEHYSATTVLFPAAVGTGCVALVVSHAYRRRAVACHQHEEAA
jgi:hypothetical protein